MYIYRNVFGKITFPSLIPEENPEDKMFYYVIYIEHEYLVSDMRARCLEINEGFIYASCPCRRRVSTIYKTKHDYAFLMGGGQSSQCNNLDSIPEKRSIRFDRFCLGEENFITWQGEQSRGFITLKLNSV